MNRVRRLREQLADAVQGVYKNVRDFFTGGSNEPSVSPAPTPEPLQPDVPPPIVVEDTPDITPADDTFTRVVTEFAPEDFGEEPDEGEDIELVDPNEIDASQLRRIFATAAEAFAYANEIPVPTRVFRRIQDLLFQVEVLYP